MEKSSSIRIHFRDNPDLMSAFSGKEVGDRCPGIELRDLVVAEKTPDSVTLHYKKMAVDGYKPTAENKDGAIGYGPETPPASIEVG